MTGDNGNTVASRIEAARSGRPEAVDRLLERYRNYLRVLAHDRIFESLRGKVDASDVAQEVLIVARRQVPGFRGDTEAELLAWLRRILAGRLVDLARRFHTPGGRAVIRERSLEDGLRASSQALGRLLPSAGTSPGRHAERRETAAVVADALARLPRDQEEVIRLRSIHELGWNEVARRMGRSNDAVRQLWVRAIKRIRPLVEDLR